MAYSKKYKGIEKRRYLRLDGDSSPAVYYLQKRSTQEIKESFLNNISVNGFSFDILEPINPGAKLECEIYRLIDCERNIIVPISVLARVVWIRKLDCSSEFNENRYRLGLRFIGSSKNKEKIASYIAVKDMMKKQAMTLNSKKKQKD